MTHLSKVRKSILKNRGVELEKHTRRPVEYDDLPATFHKTRAMRYIELKFNGKLESLISGGTIYQAGKRLGLHPTTVYKWRLVVAEAREKEFWSQFE